MRRLKEAAVESAFKAVRELEERLGPVSAAVVGSYARGDFNQWSDLTFSSSHPTSSETPSKGLSNSSKYPCIEIIPSEFLRQLRLKTPLAAEAITRGIVLRTEEFLGYFFNDSFSLTIWLMMLHAWASLWSAML